MLGDTQAREQGAIDHQCAGQQHAAEPRRCIVSARGAAYEPKITTGHEGDVRFLSRRPTPARIQAITLHRSLSCRTPRPR